MAIGQAWRVNAAVCSEGGSRRWNLTEIHLNVLNKIAFYSAGCKPNLGADWSHGVRAGLCALYLYQPASWSNGGLGCRLASAPETTGSRAWGQSATWGLHSLSGNRPEKTEQGRGGK